MRDKADELEEAKVDVRKEDKTIRPFIIPTQADVSGVLLNVTSFDCKKRARRLSVRKSFRFERVSICCLVARMVLAKVHF